MSLPLVADPHRSSKVAQLRKAIDSGDTGDKVAAGDPAASPLGTDEEAAGTPVSSAAALAAHAQETRGVKSAPGTEGFGAITLLTLVILIAIVAFLSTIWLRFD